MRLLLIPTFFLLAFAGTPSFAAVTDCAEDAPDGRAICFEQQPLAWSFTPCENEPPNLADENVWCIVGGGTPSFGGGCTGSTGSSDETVIADSVAFTSRLAGAGTCSVASDTGWNAVFDGSTTTGSLCPGGTGQKFQEGYLVGDSRHITLSCQGNAGAGTFADIRWFKNRQLGCPFGSTPRTVTRNGASITVCTLRLVECPTCNGNTVGNPVTPGDRIKVEAVNDYRGAGGLVFTRYHHAFFPDPVTLNPDGHTPRQLGGAWRSNFDKRVIPVGNAPGINALSFPDGSVQYFNAQGLEIFNYSGARASLVTLPGGGYVYQAPDAVETYGADGRLQSVTQRSGETLALTYGGGTLVDTNGNPTADSIPANAKLLLSVSDSYGNTLSFKYTGEERLAVMTDPSGGRTLYRYDISAVFFGGKANENLVSVTYPDGSMIGYLYNEAANVIPSSFAGFAKHQLTSIVDENASLYGTFKYDANNRVLSTEHAGQMRYQFTTPTGSTTGITDPLGTLRTYSFSLQNTDGVSRFSGNSLQGGAGFGTGIKTQTYDAAGNLLSKIDFNNNQTCYAYDTTRNLETVRVEGLASTASCTNVTGPGAALPAGSRKISTDWDPRWRLPTRIAEPRRITTNAYNGNNATCAPASAVIADGSPSGQPIGVLCSRTVQSTTDVDGSQGFSATLEGQPRTSTYTYDSHGHVLTANGPRTDVADVTSTIYYADDDADPGKRGNVATVTNALGHVTSITAYNAHGQPLTIVDPNGLTTDLTYDLRHRLKTRSVGGELTSYDYDFVGQMRKVTLPDGSFLSYSYDAAHRLKGMSDNLGNSITYTLDPMGNRTLDQVFDPTNTLAQTRSRVFNSLNQLFQEIGATGQTTQYAYDTQGNATSVTDPLNHATANAYDALNRLRQVTDPNNGITQYAYNGIDQLVSVTDPRNLATTYNYDGLSNLNSQLSPDTGSTVNTYDEAGNLRTQRDAKGQLTTYGYDALNRVSSIAFADGSAQTYAYDQGPNGLGRLTSITETSAASQVTSIVAYTYDQHGRVGSETRTINGVPYALVYSYDGFGRLSGMTYPSGRTITYGFDTLGRVNQVNTTPLGGNLQVVASNVAYQPFGGVKSYTLGNGRNYVRSYDQDGRIASYTQGGQTFLINYDNASRVIMISEQGNAANQNTYGYDFLDRLTSAQLPNLPFAYTYDAVGNRASKTVGAATDIYAYSATSNQISSITPQAGAARNFIFDPNGSSTNDGVNQYAYDARGRMVQSTGALGVTTYQVNALGQRFRKTNSTDDRVFLYDTRGRLIAETDPGGGLKREYLYLNDIPLAVIQ